METALFISNIFKSFVAKGVKQSVPERCIFIQDPYSIKVVQRAFNP